MLEQPYLQRATIIAGIVLAVATALTTVQAHRLSARLEAANAELEQLRTATPKAGQHGDEVAALRHQLQQEKERYARLQERKTTAEETAALAGTPTGSTASAGNPADRGAPPTFADFQARMNARIEQLKKEDPERYKRMVQSRQDRQKAAEQALTEQVTSLAQRAQATANPKEADIITQVATTLDQINQLRQSRSELHNLPPEQQQVQAQQIGEQLQQARQTLETLRQKDRAIQTENLATSLGLQGSGVQTLVSGLEAIQKNTQYSAGDHQHGFNGGGPFSNK